MSDADAETMFRKLRWPDTHGEPVCPHCGGLNAYECRRPNGALRFRCRACRADFTITSGTLFAFHKLPLRGYLAAIAVVCNEVKGKSALALSRDLNVSYSALSSAKEAGFYRLRGENDAAEYAQQNEHRLHHPDPLDRKSCRNAERTLFAELTGRRKLWPAPPRAALRPTFATGTTKRRARNRSRAEPSRRAAQSVARCAATKARLCSTTARFAASRLSSVAAIGSSGPKTNPYGGRRRGRRVRASRSRSGRISPCPAVAGERGWRR